MLDHMTAVIKFHTTSFLTDLVDAGHEHSNLARSARAFLAALEEHTEVHLQERQTT